MLSKSFKAKFEFIQKMIDDLEFVITKHNGIVNALNDREGQLATLMALSQIGECLHKIDKDILTMYNLLEDSKGAYLVRNFIAYDYEGINFLQIEDIIRINIPILKQKIEKVLTNE